MPGLCVAAHVGPMGWSNHLGNEWGRAQCLRERSNTNYCNRRYPIGNWQRQSKLTLGQTAARAGRRAIMQLLLKRGLDPNERGIRMETPLHQASRWFVACCKWTIDLPQQHRRAFTLILLRQRQDAFRPSLTPPLLTPPLPYAPSIRPTCVSMFSLSPLQARPRKSCRTSLAAWSERGCERRMGWPNPSTLCLSVRIPRGMPSPCGAAVSHNSQKG